MGYICVTRQFISPSSEPCAAPAASTSASAILCISHLQCTTEWTGHLCGDYRQNTEANSKNPFKPSQHSKLFSSVTKLALTCTRILISPKEGHGAKVFHQSEQQIYHLGTIQITKEPSCKKNVNSFWHEISALIENC